MSEPGYGLDAVLVALSGAIVDIDRPWYVTAKQLQIVSLDICAAWRRRSKSHVFVSTSTPRRLWLRHEHERFMKRNSASRVPVWHGRAITWETTSEPISEGSELFKVKPARDPERGCGWGCLRRRVVDQEWWPESLRELTFGRWFNDTVDNIIWPECLEQITFGENFNQPMNSVVWPGALEQLTFGQKFNWPVDKIRWPDSLQELTFGKNFNRPLDSVMWPVSLLHITFGNYYNQPVEDVKWPVALKQVAFGERFNQPIERAEWPRSMDRVTVGKGFRQNVGKVKRRGISVYQVGVGWSNDEHRLL